MRKNKLFEVIFRSAITQTINSFTSGQPFSGNLSDPQFERLRFRRRDGLDNAENAFNICTVSFVLFAICGRQFQAVTICHDLTSLCEQSLLQLAPIRSGITTTRQN